MALALGFPSRRRLLQQMSHADLVEWMAYYSLEPWGFEADGYHAGLIASTVANFAGKESRKPLTAQDFMPQRAARTARPATLADRRAKDAAIWKALGRVLGKPKKRKRKKGG